ncbi:mechanosensitive ion channel family protein [Rhodoferax antarcticus]|nr:mechanosensitive ion channel family protein [Rhodoferax antarcticus]APW47713.1 mechanosensitive ion channel protein MscS [Rhodoferax antarcticus]MCW2312534.1 small-conductance mechanosensitive channel [Rhodoferax antarcticus]
MTANTWEHWSSALLAIAIFLALFYILRRVVLGRLKKLSTRTDTLIDDFFYEVLSATRVLLAGAVSLYLAQLFLIMPASLEKATGRIFVALLLLQTGFWVARGLDFWLRHRLSHGEPGEQGAREMTRSLLSFLGRVVMWSLVFLLILDNLGLNVSALIASLGIGGIAVALAVQNILGDLFASLSIAIDKPFVIGDFIVVDDLVGTVEHVGLKTSRLRSLSGEQIVVSNNDLLKSRIRNFKRMQQRRVVFAIGVTYDTPRAKLEAIPLLVRSAVEAQDNTRFDRAHLKGFGAFSLDFEIVYYVNSADFNLYMDIQQGINLQLIDDFKGLAIEFAFPTQTLHVASIPPVSGSLSSAVDRRQLQASAVPGSHREPV